MEAAALVPGLGAHSPVPSSALDSDCRVYEWEGHHLAFTVL